MKSIKKFLIATLFFTVPTFVLASMDLNITGNCLDTDRAFNNKNQLNSISCDVETRINGGAVTNSSGELICVVGQDYKPHFILVCNGNLIYKSEIGQAYTVNSSEVTCHTDNVQWIVDGNDMVCKEK